VLVAAGGIETPDDAWERIQAADATGAVTCLALSLRAHGGGYGVICLQSHASESGYLYSMAACAASKSS
jgi:hypothetical protein